MIFAMSYKLLCRVFSSNPLNLSKKPPDAFAQDFVSQPSSHLVKMVGEIFSLFAKRKGQEYLWAVIGVPNLRTPHTSIKSLEHP